MALLILMVCVTRNPVWNLNSLKISGEVFSDLWLQASGSLLKNHPNERVQKIIANRTQTRILSFEFAIRICKMFWFVWAYLTCSEYDIWAIAIIQINIFSFWHMNDIPCKTLTFRVFISSMLFDLTMIWRGPANVWFPRTGFRRFTNFCFWNPLMAIFKGLEPQNSALFWELWNSINCKCSVTYSDGFECLQKSIQITKNQ